MYCWWFFLTVCIYGIVAFRIEDELEDHDFWPNDQLALTVNDGNSKCKNDILLVVDTSQSIGNTHFNKNVKPFLRHFVTDSRLNVGLYGTWIGLVIFSQKDKTKKILDVGEIKDPEELVKKINSKLDYNQVMGDHTRTDMGLTIANNIFSQYNPWNNRRNADDVVILITDGEPTGTDDVVKETKKYAKNLKDKHIFLIVAAVGPKRKKPRFKSIMRDLASSPSDVLEADFHNMKNIIDKLADRYCTQTVYPGFCSCRDKSQPIIRTIDPGKSTVEVSEDDLTVLPPTCENGASVTNDKPKVNPPLPRKFSVGTRVVNFTFSLEKAITKTVTCSVEVKVKVMCDGVAYFPSEKSCCCGTIHQKITGYKCCGQDYYNPTLKKCCWGVNLVSLSELC